MMSDLELVQLFKASLDQVVEVTLDPETCEVSVAQFRMVKIGNIYEVHDIIAGRIGMMTLPHMYALVCRRVFQAHIDFKYKQLEELEEKEMEKRQD